MKFKRIIGLGLTLVMALTSVTVGFAEETAEISELTETIDAEDSVMNDTSETVEIEEPIETEEIVETEETMEIDSAEKNETEAETEEVTETALETEEAAESETELNNADELAEEVVLEEDKNVDLDTSSFTYGDYTYTISDSSTVIISQYNGSSSSVTLPTSVTYNGTTYKIRKVGSNAFDGNTSLQTLVIPNGITSLGNAAFKNCTSLSSITINGDLVDCSSSSKSSSVSNNYSGYSVFYNAGANSQSLTVTFGSGVTYVPAYLFATASSKSDGYYAHVTKVNFSNTVTEVGSYAFYYCYDLTAITMSSGLMTIGSYAFYSCTSLSDPGWGSNLTTIGSYAFANDTALKTLNFPSNLKYINEFAFESCSGVTSITLPSSVTTLGNCAFKNCTLVSSIKINGDLVDCDKNSASSTVTNNYSKYSVFYNVGANAQSLTVTFGSGVTYVLAYLFATISSKSDGYYAHVTKVNFSNTITEIGRSAFYYCHDLTTMDMSSGITTINPYAFYNCTSLSDPGWGSNLTTIGSYAFANDTNLKTLNFPSSLKYINEYAFESCSGVTSIIFPFSVTTLGNCAFKNCTLVSSITINGDLVDCNKNSASSTVSSNYSKYSVFYNAGANTQSMTVTFGSGVTYVPAYLFATGSSKSDGYYAHVTTVVIPSTVKKIGDYAFYRCYDLEAAEIPSSVTSIGANTFGGDSNATLYVKSGSYALTYAKTYSIAYVIGSIPIVVSPPSFAVAGVFGGRNVTFTSATAGAVIYYSSTTSNITTNDTCVSNGETVLFEDFYGTIYAKAYYNGTWSNISRLILKIPVTNTPTITVSGTKATIKSSTPSAYIYYTTDGSTPSISNGTNLGLNGGTVAVNDDDIIKAIAVRSCFTNSSVASYSMPNAFDGTVYPPSFNVVGTFGGRNVTFASNTGKAKIYYSSTTSSLTTSDNCISNGETVLFEDFYGTIYARAYYNGVWSNVARLILKIPTINTPTITYSGGKATIRTTTPSCYIYYTTDGSTPSITNGKKLCSNSYGQVTVSSGTTIKAIAVRSCFTNSEVVSYKVS